MAGNGDTLDGADVEPDGAPDAARVMLARKLRSAWEASESKLALDRLEAKLKERLHGQNVKGLGRSSIGRYMDPEHTTLPDKAVLTALAEIFRVSNEELAAWHRLQTEAKAAQRQRRLQRPAADHQGVSALPQDAADSPPPSQEEDVPGDADPVVDASAAPCMDSDREESEGHDQPVSVDSPAGRSPGARRSRPRIPVAVKYALYAVATAGVIALGVVTAVNAGDDSPDRTPAKSQAPQSSATTETHPGAAGSSTGNSPSSASAAVSPGAVSGNFRCGRERHVSTVTWAPCTQVRGNSLVFAVQLSNTGSSPVTVKAKLAYVQTQQAHSCPAPWGAGAQVTVPAGKTVTSTADACSVTKIPTTAFQGKAWVIATDEPSWGYREMSQTVHVQPDASVRWADEE
ncbi:hypothetical protein ABT001_30495 [Streptomyces sp. NPDC002793]|uniref:hypothetical protein n=1 Tax=Streptomyces sp. NPDC002793 TaxID=3154432 RepID=UPI0033349C3E